MTTEMQPDHDRLRTANREAKALLAEAAAGLRSVLDDEAITEETPLEATAAIEEALKAIDAAAAKLQTTKAKRRAASTDAPTHQQGQFLAFIREYMMRNHAGVAPTHANFQRFFILTAPSVNFMLIRLERRGFIRRIPHQARGIELTVKSDWIPPLDRPFRLW
jgi:hypothetical protein